MKRALFLIDGAIYLDRTYILSREPYISSKELYIQLKQHFILSKYQHIRSKEHHILSIKQKNRIFSYTSSTFFQKIVLRTCIIYVKYIKPLPIPKKKGGKSIKCTYFIHANILEVVLRTCIAYMNKPSPSKKKKWDVTYAYTILTDMLGIVFRTCMTYMDWITPHKKIKQTLKPGNLYRFVCGVMICWAS